MRNPPAVGARVVVKDAPNVHEDLRGLAGAVVAHDAPITQGETAGYACVAFDVPPEGFDFDPGWVGPIDLLDYE